MEVFKGCFFRNFRYQKPNFQTDQKFGISKGRSELDSANETEVTRILQGDFVLSCRVMNSNHKVPSEDLVSLRFDHDLNCAGSFSLVGSAEIQNRDKFENSSHLCQLTTIFDLLAASICLAHVFKDYWSERVQKRPKNEKLSHEERQES
jgi:hypothetical protein